MSMGFWLHSRIYRIQICQLLFPVPTVHANIMAPEKVENSDFIQFKYFNPFPSV